MNQQLLLGRFWSHKLNKWQGGYQGQGEREGRRWGGRKKRKGRQDQRGCTARGRVLKTSRGSSLNNNGNAEIREKERDKGRHWHVGGEEETCWRVFGRQEFVAVPWKEAAKPEEMLWGTPAEWWSAEKPAGLHNYSGTATSHHFRVFFSQKDFKK